MHILLGFLTTIVTILVLLNRLGDLGINIHSVNPFLWRRRRKWIKQQSGNPLFRLSSPMETAGVLVVGVAKADGAISLEEKKMIQSIFESDFHLSSSDSTGLFTSSAFLIGDNIDIQSKLKAILKPCKDQFTDSQIESTLSMIHQVASIGGTTHPKVADYVAEVERLLSPVRNGDEVWQP